MRSIAYTEEPEHEKDEQDENLSTKSAYHADFKSCMDSTKGEDGPCDGNQGSEQKLNDNWVIEIYPRVEWITWWEVHGIVYAHCA